MIPADVTAAPPPDIPAGLEDLLPAFIAEMAKDAARLQGLAGGDRGALVEHVHAMRGKCAMFGEQILFERLTRLESEAAAAADADILRMIDEVVERSSQLADLPVRNRRP